MKPIRKILKMTLLVIAGIVLIVIISTILLMNLHPAFGGKIDKYPEATNFKDGIFVNQTETSMDLGFKGFMYVLKEYVKGAPGREPEGTVPVTKRQASDFKHSSLDETKFTWFGHSAILMETSGKLIFFDPMLGDSPAPFSFLGPGRFSTELPITAEELPYLDYVVISHDHYDHLDYPTIKKIRDKTGLFLVPLGVKAHLVKWDVEPSKIIELNWWENYSESALVFTCAPARHFSGRGFFDRFKTLWCSWIVQANEETIYFSGDSGYGPHFKEIGERFGPVDLAFLECGQYNELWHPIHMMPEETLIAAEEIGAGKIVPIHWGAFRLALHHWKDPVERLEKGSGEKFKDRLIFPGPGEKFGINSVEDDQDTWWKRVH